MREKKYFEFLEKFSRRTQSSYWLWVRALPGPLTFRETLFSDEAETDISLKQCDIGSQSSLAQVIIAANSENIIGRKSHHRNGPMIAKPDY
jgi:hypothetical protein